MLYIKFDGTIESAAKARDGRRPKPFRFVSRCITQLLPSTLSLLTLTTNPLTTNPLTTISARLCLNFSPPPDSFVIAATSHTIALFVSRQCCIVASVRAVPFYDVCSSG